MTVNIVSILFAMKDLYADVYPQPPDFVHMRWTRQIIDEWIPKMEQPINTVVDMGCGEAYAQCFFEKHGIKYTGVCLETDYLVAKKKGRNVYNMDFSGTEFPDDYCDMVFARHSLEHSPMPIISLMEWYRVSKRYLGLVMPRPEHWGWGGQNHYSIMTDSQIRFLLDRAGWNIVDYSETEEEYRYLCEKKS
jgi:ubiquinone/menaquinone biosynthesis C-methylase UbiE